MRFEFRMPDIGEGVSEGEIVQWHVTAGDTVSEEDPMVEVTTDKATVTIDVPRAGIVADLCAKVGDIVNVGTVIAVIDTEATQENRPVQQGTPSSGPAATAVGDIKDSGLPGVLSFTRSRRPSVRPAGGNGGSDHPHAPFSDNPLATPAVRKLARDMGVELGGVPSTGEGGRITRTDVMTFIKQTGAGAVLNTRESRLETDTHVLAPRPLLSEPPTAVHDLEERRPFVGIRRRIAERMQHAKNTAAHFTFVEECDVTHLCEVRERLLPEAEAHGVKLAYLPFIVKATVGALKKHLELNTILDEEAHELVTRRYFHIGIATATERGLLVPVLRHADRLSILEIAREIDRLARGAREGSLSPAELKGSTFTVTSLGKHGGLLATPVLNFPEVGVLAVHRIRERAVVRDGQITIGDVMMLSLSFDHRLIDGHVGAAFTYEIIRSLENPERMFLEMH
ncbi:MAG: 2-oxo acid dehydrogenase subunit E2 [Myxococcales bacterium]|nr:2-oxo acid dehydrogenase subunit E2 [Myxococcales bacterium]MCB9707424.1 2-oxo acid dehydrogenase subunit E2 [Myxococcales bacterium]